MEDFKATAITRESEDRSDRLDIRGSGDHTTNRNKVTEVFSRHLTNSESLGQGSRLEVEGAYEDYLIKNLTVMNLLSTSQGRREGGLVVSFTNRVTLLSEVDDHFKSRAIIIGLLD